VHNLWAYSHAICIQCFILPDICDNDQIQLYDIYTFLNYVLRIAHEEEYVTA